MLRLSSNLTLFFKLFIPTLWLTFFGMILIGVLLIGSDDPFLSSTVFKIGYAAFYLFFATIIFFTILPLKRVEYQDDLFYATNYFKSIRFNPEAIDRISHINLGILSVYKIRLKNKSTLGRTITFIAKRINVDTISAMHPDLFH